MMRIGFAPVAPAFNVKPAQTSKPNPLVSNLPALKPLQADTVSLGTNTPSAVGLRSGAIFQGVGLDVGATNTKGGAVTFDTETGLATFKTHTRFEEPTPRAPEELVNLLAQQYIQIADSTGLSLPPVGISFAGPTDAKTGTIINATNISSDYTNFELKRRFEQSVWGLQPQDVSVMNDLAAFVRAFSDPAKYVIGIAGGTGVGIASQKPGGIIDPSEGGHTVVDRTESHESGLRTVEQRICGIVRLFKQQVEIDQKHNGGLLSNDLLQEVGDIDNITLDVVKQAHENWMGDKAKTLASLTQQRWLETLGIAIANSVNGREILANTPPSIKLGGTVIEYWAKGNEALGRLTDIMNKDLITPMKERVSVSMTPYGENTNIVGAALEAIHKVHIKS